MLIARGWCLSLQWEITTFGCRDYRLYKNNGRSHLVCKLLFWPLKFESAAQYKLLDMTMSVQVLRCDGCQLQTAVGNQHTTKLVERTWFFSNHNQVVFVPKPNPILTTALLTVCYTRRYKCYIVIHLRLFSQLGWGPTGYLLRCTYISGSVALSCPRHNLSLDCLCQKNVIFPFK